MKRIILTLTLALFTLPILNAQDIKLNGTTSAENNQIKNIADPTDAHEQIFGEVDTGDVTQKASLAATLGRVQKDNNKRHIKIERDAEHLSILAQDEKMQKLDQVTPDDMRTPTEKEVPNALQQPDGATSGVAEEVNNTEELDYNFDVAYLQKYGRA